MRGALAALLLLIAGGGAQAQVISPAPDKVAVTVYHDGPVDTETFYGSNFDRGAGFALVAETRSFDLPAGNSTIAFRGVAGTMVPQTAEVTGLPRPPAESDFDYDLLSNGSLVSRFIGKTVRLVRTDRNTGASHEESATLRSGPQGVVLETAQGVEALGCSGLPEALVFDSVPEGLQAGPTLSLHVAAAKAGRYTVTLRYLATGIGWAADYVVHVKPDGRTLDLSGWITIANRQASGFAQAPVDVIAGHLNTTYEDVAPRIKTLTRSNACWPTAISWGTFVRPPAVTTLRAPAPPPPPAKYADQEMVVVSGSKIEARDLGDYKQYPLPQPTDLAALQTKQVQFLDQREVAAERIYTVTITPYDLDEPSGGEDQARAQASILFRLRNDVAHGLGKALPAGGIATMTEAGDGAPLLLAKDTLGDTPVDLPLEIPGGETDKVWIVQRVTESSKVEHGKRGFWRKAVEVTIANDKPSPVAFELRQRLFDDGSLVSENIRHAAKNGDLVWAVPMAPGERKVLRYTLDLPR